MEGGGFRWETAVFLGLREDGPVSAAKKSELCFLFSTDGVEKKYAVTDRNGFAVQNQLREGEVFRIALCSGTVVAAELLPADAYGTVTEEGTIVLADGRRLGTEGIPTEEISCCAGRAAVRLSQLRAGDRVCAVFLGGDLRRIYRMGRPAEPYRMPVCGTPGKRTLRNFLATALEPAGTTLYVYGGGWNWQDDGAGAAAVSLGLSPCWIAFFQCQDENYSYRNDADFSRSWYPHHGWNEYGWAGLDCSGYVGWAVYNLMHESSGLPGYVQSAAEMARDFARRGWGEWSRESASFCPGDIISIPGHVWICLGACGDGSLVILHATPSPSRTGALGGGVQLSAVGEREDCEAHSLASSYMERFYPQWSGRYAAVCKPYAMYTALGEDPRTGKFRWNLQGILRDPEGVSQMGAEEILRELFEEKQF